MFKHWLAKRAPSLGLLLAGGIAMLLAVPLLVGLVALNSVIDHRFEAADRLGVAREAEHLELQIAAGMVDVQTLCADWAEWDGVRDSIAGKSKGFLALNAAAAWRVRLRMDAVVLFDADGEVTGAIGGWPDHRAVDGPVPAVLRDAWLAAGNGPRSGWIVHGTHVYFVAMEPVREGGEPTGRKVGTLLMARDADQTLEGEMAQRFDVTLRPVSAPPGDGRPGERAVRFEGDEAITYITIRDPRQHVAGAFELRMQRPLADLQLRNNRLTTMVIVLMIFGSLVPFVIMLRVVLLKPMQDAARQIQSVGTSGDFSQRIRVLALSRESQQVLKSVNSMLDQLERVHEVEGARDAALQASRVKSDFLATMSHEVRTPMNGVLGMTELLLQTALDERQRRYATTAQTSAQATLEVLDQVLDYARLDTGRTELRLGPVELADVLEDTAGRFRAVAAARGIDFAVHAPQLPPVQADGLRLQQVLGNLVGNALKFTPEGRVRVAAEVVARDLESATVRFVVSDTGVGIPPGALEKLFQPFSQADSSASRRYGGTGLGLAICHGLVALMGGKIEATSRVDEGSTFTFTLVLPWASAPAAALTRAAVESPVIPSAESLN